MIKGLSKYQDLTIKEVLEMLDPMDGQLELDDVKVSKAKNGQTVVENIHAEDCPCKELANLVNESFGTEIISFSSQNNFS